MVVLTGTPALPKGNVPISTDSLLDTSLPTLELATCGANLNFREKFPIYLLISARKPVPAKCHESLEGNPGGLIGSLLVGILQYRS